MDSVDVAKTVSAKAAAVVERLMDELVPEMTPVMEKLPDIEALPERSRLGSAQVVAAKTVAIMIIAWVLRMLRKANYPDEAIDVILAEARDREKSPEALS